MDQIELNDLKYDLSRVMESLFEREKDILIKRYIEGRSCSEIGKDYDLTGSAINEVSKRALRKMRHPRRLEQLMTHYSGFIRPEMKLSGSIYSSENECRFNNIERYIKLFPDHYTPNAKETLLKTHEEINLYDYEKPKLEKPKKKVKEISLKEYNIRRNRLRKLREQHENMEISLRLLDIKNRINKIKLNNESN